MLAFLRFLAWTLGGFIVGVLFNVVIELAAIWLTDDWVTPYPFPAWVRTVIPYLAAIYGLSRFAQAQQSRIPSRILRQHPPSDLARTTTNQIYLRRLSKSRDSQVREAVANNRTAPADVLESLLEDDAAHVRAAAHRSNLSRSAKDTIERTHGNHRSSSAARQDTSSASEAARMQSEGTQPSNHEDLLSQLERLGALHEAGHISDDEFDRLKKSVMDRS